MAAAGKSSAAIALLLALAAAAALLAPAAASTLTVFQGPGCSGASKDVGGCGCSSIAGYQGGFHFVYTGGQAANLYSAPNCAGRFSPTHLNVETRSCAQSAFLSVDMFC